jgi:hypothetical protein
MKPKQLTMPSVSISCKATTIFKQQGTDFLTVAYELTIENGVVIHIKSLNAADMPASSIGKASSSLWNCYRNQIEK